MWREELRKKYWVLHGNWTHDFPDTSGMLALRTTDRATKNSRDLVMSRSFAGRHKDCISQSHYVKLTQINSVSFSNLLVLLEVEELVVYSWLLSGSHPQVLWCTNPKNVKTKELSIKMAKEKIKIGLAMTY